MKREIFLLAGEASGDARGAELIRELRKRDPSLIFSGMGGPLMKAEGMDVIVDLTPLAVVGIVEVLKHYGTFKKAMGQLYDEILYRTPMAVIGVDYPGFNLRLLKKIRFAFGENRPKLIQYVSPQLWAWDENRKWKMAKYLDLVLCIFPFEPAYYEQTGLRAVFVGHPLAQSTWFGEEKRDSNLIALFPGSREKEIRAHMPILAELTTEMQKSNSKLKFSYACSSPAIQKLIQSYSPNANFESATHLQTHAMAGVVCSGTATLESALAGLPMCVIYKVAWTTYWMGKFLIKVPYLAMPNLLSKKELIQEFIQTECNVANLKNELEFLINDRNHRQQILDGYQLIKNQLTGVTVSAADEILKTGA